MVRWAEFGRHANRLVYALAGAKFSGDIEAANRYLAEAVHYSESSVRAMRQGRFRPQGEPVLEAMAAIGKLEADLPRDWALALLRHGGHRDPEHVLRQLYPLLDEPQFQDLSPPAPTNPRSSVVPLLALRMVGGITGLLIFLILWAFVISPGYPPAHELPIVREMLWGASVGAGVALGLAAAEVVWGLLNQQLVKTEWLQDLVLILAGAGGGLLWNRIAFFAFPQAAGRSLQSSWFETLAYGMVYAASFMLASVIVLRRQFHLPITKTLVLPYAAAVVWIGAAALGGYFLAVEQNSLRSQQTVDIFVGLSFRFGLALACGVLFPPARRLTTGRIQPAAGIPWTQQPKWPAGLAETRSIQ